MTGPDMSWYSDLPSTIYYYIDGVITTFSIVVILIASLFLSGCSVSGWDVSTKGSVARTAPAEVVAGGS